MSSIGELNRPHARDHRIPVRTFDLRTEGERPTIYQRVPVPAEPIRPYKQSGPPTIDIGSTAWAFPGQPIRLKGTA